MNSAEEYLKRTESAVIKIFDGINLYFNILHNSPPPIYIGNAGDTLSQKPTYRNWVAANKNTIQSSFKAQREFWAEDFALATLCASLLQIAAMGLQWFSENEEIPEDLPEVLLSRIKPKSKSVKFCIGRRVRNLPIGLIIYAGRNQSNHMDDDELKEPNKTIFNLLAHNYAGATEQSPRDPALLIFWFKWYREIQNNQFIEAERLDLWFISLAHYLIHERTRDPAFDLENEMLINFSSNITALLEWRNYESYYADMKSLIAAA